MFQEAEWAEWRTQNPVGTGLLEEVGLREPDEPDWDDGAEESELGLAETGFVAGEEFANRPDRESAESPAPQERRGWGPRADGKRRGEDEEEEFEEDDDVE